MWGRGAQGGVARGPQGRRGTWGNAHGLAWQRSGWLSGQVGDEEGVPCKRKISSQPSPIQIITKESKQRIKRLHRTPYRNRIIQSKSSHSRETKIPFKKDPGGFRNCKTTRESGETAGFLRFRPWKSLLLHYFHVMCINKLFSCFINSQKFI